MQSYNNGLDAQQQAYHRSQLVLDEQNTIELNKLKSLQREQEVQAARAEGEKAKAKAAGDAAAEIETAKGHATANRLEAASLTPSLLKLQMMQTLTDKHVVYLPSNVLPLAQLGLDK
jgi:citrate lyase beta subunit